MKRQAPQPSPPLRSPGQRRPDLTREALLRAGERLFASGGFAGVTTDQLASSAGVNKAMIQYHFGGKDALYRAILLRILDPAVHRLRGLREPTSPPDQRLREFIRVFGSLHQTSPALSAMVLRELLSGGQHLDETIFSRFLEVFSILREILAQGSRAGIFRPVDPMQAHIGLIGSLVFFFASAPFRDRLVTEGKFPTRAISAEGFIAHIEEVTLRGLAP